MAPVQWRRKRRNQDWPSGSDGGVGKGPVSTLQLIHSVLSAVVSALSPGPRAQSRAFILRYILLLSLKGHGSDLYSESFRSRSFHCKRQKVNLQHEVEDEGPFVSSVRSAAFKSLKLDVMHGEPKKMRERKRERERSNNRAVTWLTESFFHLTLLIRRSGSLLSGSNERLSATEIRSTFAA